jgi:hypothetical protein
MAFSSGSLSQKLFGEFNFGLVAPEFYGTQSSNHI